MALAPAGKVVWANEGFEKLTGVDAVDVVGQEICCLFEEGEGEEGEGEEGGERGELKQSLERGQVSYVWSRRGSKGYAHAPKEEHFWIAITCQYYNALTRRIAHAVLLHCHTYLETVRR